MLVTIWGSHFEKAYFARGIENFLADLAGDPDYAKRLLDFIIHKNKVMLENIVHIPGIGGILLGSDWGSQKDLLMSPQVWRELIRPGAAHGVLGVGTSSAAHQSHGYRSDISQRRGCVEKSPAGIFKAVEL